MAEVVGAGLAARGRDVEVVGADVTVAPTRGARVVVVPSPLACRVVPMDEQADTASATSIAASHATARVRPVGFSCVDRPPTAAH